MKYMVNNNLCFDIPDQLGEPFAYSYLEKSFSIAKKITFIDTIFFRNVYEDAAHAAIEPAVTL